MELLWQGSVKALELIFGFDAEVWSITWLSIKISGCATLVSLLVGVPLGIVLALARFRGRWLTGLQARLRLRPLPGVLESRLHAVLQARGRLVHATGLPEH